MAEETEKEMLLRKIHYMTELINSHGAEQSNDTRTKCFLGSQSYSSWTGWRQPTALHQLHQSNSRAGHSSVPQRQPSHHQTVNFVPRPRLPAPSTQRETLHSRQTTHKEGTGIIPQAAQVENHIKKLGECAQELELIKLKTHNTSKATVEGSAWNETRNGGGLEAPEKAGKVAPQIKHSTSHLSLYKELGSRSAKVCATLSLYKSMLAECEAAKRNLSNTSACSKTFTRSDTSACSKTVTRSDTSTCSKTVTRSDTSACSRAVTLADVNKDLSGVSRHSKEGSQPKEKESDCVERSERGEVGAVMANTAGRGSLQASKKQTNVSAGSSAFSADAQPQGSAKNAEETDYSMKDVQDPVFRKTTQQDSKKGACSLLPSVSLQPVTSQNNHTSQPTKQDKVALARSSSVVTDLKKELQATQEKLVGMRKKIGVMLKESPLKTQSSADRASQHQKTDPAASAAVSPRSLCKHGHPTMATASSSVPANKRPFPNRKSLRWSPQESPLQSSSEESLVVRSSSNMRFPHKVSRTDQQGTPSERFSFTPVRAGYPSRSKRSRFSLVRKHTALLQNTSSKALSSKLATTSPSAPGKLHNQAPKPFVGRYKFQRLCSNTSKENVNKNNIQSTPGKFSVSRYKLMKTSAYSYVNPAHCSTSQTASQRAAKIIKSKYKMRKVFISPSACSTSIVPKQYLTTRQPAERSLKSSAQSYAWTKTPRYAGLSYPYMSNSRYSRPSPFHCTTARKNLFSSRQKVGKNRSAYNFYGWSWSRQQSQSDTAPWWMWQYSRKSYLYQQAWRRKMKALSVWRRQRRLNALAGSYPGTPWNHKAQRARKEQLRKKLLLKRLQWIQKYNMARKRLSWRESSPTKGRPNKQAHLVMINGILYQSSSRRLTKASSSSAVSATTSSNNTTTNNINTSAASGVVSIASRSELSTSTAVVVRSMKQHKMQTVTVRGVRFKMDSRGTKLQRVHSHTQQDKSNAVSRVDVGGTTYVQTEDGVLEKISDSQTRTVVNRVKQRSIARATAKFKKDNTERKKVKKACLFYSRFGKCSRGNDCPYLHDPDKIAVCTRFLRGTCKVEKCLFSHKVSKEKMPVCAFFLRGVCTREQCPYLHVKVTHGADICKDFVNGFCPLADKCQKLHTLTCPHFTKTGECPDGRKCRLLHRKSTYRAPRRTSSGPTQQNSSLSGSSIKRKAPSAEARSVEQKEPQQVPEDSRIPHKRFKPDADLEPQAPGSSSTALKAAQAPAVPKATQAPAASTLVVKVVSSPQHSNSRSVVKRDCWEKGEEQGEKFKAQTAKLPAFISLADYTVDSPVVRLLDSQRQKISSKIKGTSLQIKPRI